MNCHVRHVDGSRAQRDCPIHGGKAPQPPTAKVAMTSPPQSLSAQQMDVLQSAARLQELVGGDITLVGGSAAVAHAGHRLSLDRGHVLTDLRTRYESVIEALESCADWRTARTSYQRIMLGSLGDIEGGVRQLRRSRPLEVAHMDLGDGHSVRIPTSEEMLRIKAWMVVTRNAMRDYLDVAAIADHIGLLAAARVLLRMDDYYDSGEQDPSPVTSQVVRQLADPRPVDGEDPDRYRGVQGRWRDFSETTRVCKEVAMLMTLNFDSTGGHDG